MSKVTCFTDEKTSPCVRSKRPRVFRAPRAHVFQHVRVVPVHTGDVFESTQGGFFLRAKPHKHNTTPRKTHTPHKPRTPTRNNHTETGQRQRQRQRQRTETETGQRTEKEDRGQREKEKTEEERQDKRREDQKKTRQDKTREKIHFQCGGAWPFFC